MPDHPCERCGAAVEWKNAAGHYRDVCEECAQQVADEREPKGRAALEREVFGDE
jgi:endogenous inhibitor of DNA gyrase (YacG/DUF329 family)